jgi:hypothetical protein
MFVDFPGRIGFINDSVLKSGQHQFISYLYLIDLKNKSNEIGN